MAIWARSRLSRFGERPGELLNPTVDFNEGVRARGELALECDGEIGLENVTLPLFRVVGIKVIRGGDSVAALMLGKIHRGIRDLDQLLRRRSVGRKRCYSKAGCDVLLPQHGVGGDPGAQLRGQLMTLLGIGLGHQNYETVA